MPNSPTLSNALSFGLQGRVVIVTGAANGIGEACARRFAGEGAHVVLADVNSERGAAVAAELRSAGHSAGFANAIGCAGDDDHAALQAKRKGVGQGGWGGHVWVSRRLHQWVSHAATVWCGGLSLSSGGHLFGDLCHARVL